MGGSGLARGLGLELGTRGHLPDRDGAAPEGNARLAEDFAPAFDECLRLRHRGSHARTPTRPGGQTRSEEHTSELQSHVNLVCRLLLEKKKKITERHLHDKIKKNIK